MARLVTGKEDTFFQLIQEQDSLFLSEGGGESGHSTLDSFFTTTARFARIFWVAGEARARVK